jgi:hypothetical protein
MKIRNIVIIFCIILCNIHLQACPTCVGRLSKDSAPFFYDECYHNAELSKNSANDLEKNLSSEALEQLLSQKEEVHEE